MYYLRVNGSVYGPYTEEQIKGYIAEGRVVPESEISTDGENWQTAGYNPQFFPQGIFQPPMPNEYIGESFPADPNRSFWGCYVDCWKRYTDFSGRSRRKEYWAWSIYNSLLMMLFCLLIVPLITAGKEPSVSVTVLGLAGLAGMSIFGLAALVPGIAVLIRRLHDIGQSGWWAALLMGAQFVPGLNFAGSIALIVIASIDGQPGPNRFGPNPKGR